MTNRPFQSPETFLLRSGADILWVEWVISPFLKQEISDYLAKARRIQVQHPGGLQAALVAPDFEEGVHELFAFVRIPIRLFRYHEDSGFSPSAWRLEEVIVGEKPVEAPSEAGPPFSNRLSREELREFIQLEIDVAAGKYNKT